MKKLAVLLGAITVVVAACGGGVSTPAGSDSAQPSAQPEIRCYELIEGGSRAVIKVEPAPSANDSQGGQVTIYSYIDGVEEFAPETTAGRLEPDAFVYADGTRLALTAQSLTWPQDSMLEGAVFTSTTCP